MLYFYLNLLDTDEEKSKFEKLYYEYDSNGLVSKKTLNVLAETLENGLINVYTYDKLNRQT